MRTKESEALLRHKPAADIILFGGEKYAEPIVAQGPSVMNMQQEIAAAYSDFHSGEYGKS